jgi:hypothetical protein
MNASRGTWRLGLVVAAIVAAVAVAGCGETPFPSIPSRPPAAFGPVELTGVGDLRQGGEAVGGLILRFTEPDVDAIAAGNGSLQVSLTDHAGLPGTISFTGTPSIEAPDSLGATVSLGGDILTVEIVDSDRLNIESVTITGLGLIASSTAALGSVNAVVAGCAGSLAGCTVTNVLPSPGSVVTGE